jgi:hypothetical protein
MCQESRSHNTGGLEQRLGQPTQRTTEGDENQLFSLHHQDCSSCLLLRSLLPCLPVVQHEVLEASRDSHHSHTSEVSSLFVFKNTTGNQHDINHSQGVSTSTHFQVILFKSSSPIPTSPHTSAARPLPFKSSPLASGKALVLLRFPQQTLSNCAGHPICLCAFFNYAY